MTSTSALSELALDLAWSLWRELGVRGAVGQRHQDWSIDPEPLIAFTAHLADRDPRLRDESLDWCIHNERYISRARLRSIISHADHHTRSAVGAYTATLAQHTNRAWPHATDPWPYQPTGRSRLAPLTRPALIHVRLRAIFGVGARAEILHAFIAAPHAHMTTAQLARLTSYTKRNIAEELDRLHLGGLLAVTTPTNQFQYRLHDSTALLDFVGDRPATFPNWEPLLRTATAIIDTTDAITTAPPTTQAIELEKPLAALQHDIEAAHITPLPPDRERAGNPDTLQRWSHDLIARLAAGIT